MFYVSVRVSVCLSSPALALCLSGRGVPEARRVDGNHSHVRDATTLMVAST